MKFQKYLREVQRSSHMLRHLNYKALKAEIKRLHELVQLGNLSEEAAADLFGEQLEVEVSEVGRFWESCLWDLRNLVDELFSTTDMALSGDAAHAALCGPLGPMRLLEPLNLWLPIAALADALCRHRLLQVTAVVKIEKKFAKLIGVQLSPGQTGAELLRRSPLCGTAVHGLRHQLEAAGDALLRLGLGAQDCEPADPCSICLHDLVDPARLPCGHRVCIQCVLPLFGRASEEAGFDAALLRCPLCRAAGPKAPQALCLDSLLARLGRGLSSQFSVNVASGAGDDLQHFTAVVVSSLARLATSEAAHEKPLEHVPIRRSRSLVPPCSPLLCKVQLQVPEDCPEALRECKSFELI